MSLKLERSANAQKAMDAAKRRRLMAEIRSAGGTPDPDASLEKLSAKLLAIKHDRENRWH